MTPDLRASLSKIADTQKGKPFFFYDIDALSSHLGSLKAEGVKLWYATKANPLSRILSAAVNNGFGIDCASLGEIDQALRSGVSASSLLLTGPAKSPTLVAAALERGVRIFVLESLRQAKTVNEACIARGVQAKVLLRIQLAWTEGEKSVLGGTNATPFGLPPSAWEKLNLKELPALQVIGVHNFQWSNILSAQKLRSIWFTAATEARSLAKKMGFGLEVLDLGGGLGIPYGGESSLQWRDVSAVLAEVRKEFSIPELWLELGRYASGPFGYYIAEVSDRKEVHGKDFVVLEGGVHHLLRPAIVGEAFPCQLLRVSSASVQALQVHGPLCTALDCLGALSLPTDTQVGDALVFSQCGAYGFTESMPFFLCHDVAAEWTLEKGALHCVRPSQNPESWLH